MLESTILITSLCVRNGNPSQIRECVCLAQGVDAVRAVAPEFPRKVCLPGFEAEESWRNALLTVLGQTSRAIRQRVLPELEIEIS